jgi:hypothetical protein
MNIDWSHGIRYWRKFMIISLHFLGLSSIPRADEKLEISWTTKGNRLGEHLGTTSSAVVSSTNFRRPFQSFNNGLTKIANRRGPRHVPWGKPPLVVFHEDSWQSTLTHCWRLVKNALIQRVRTGWTLRFSSSFIITLWSTKSKPFLKSAKNNCKISALKGMTKWTGSAQVSSSF